MKLVIQIPCFNEAETLSETLADLPTQIDGIDEIETLIINDGSTDDTVQVAKQHGVNHIVSFTKNMGLATGFMAGLDACLKVGADIIVNTDADNQYQGASIKNLVEPIVKGQADVVVGDRNTDGIKHFSWTKKRLQKLGSWVVRQVSNTDVPDTTSGFRAWSREAALQMNVVSKFTYTLETIIQAGKKNLAITHVPIKTNKKLRESRLFGSNFSYIKKSMGTIARIYALYEPLKTFAYIGGTIFGIGFIIGLRFLYFYLVNDGGGHIQSLILASVLLTVGFQVAIIGLLADILGSNRQLTENVLYRLRKMQLDKRSEKSGKSDQDQNSTDFSN